MSYSKKHIKSKSSKVIPLLFLVFLLLFSSCRTGSSPSKTSNSPTAADILGNSEYTAISYGGYRTETRDNQPSIKDLKEDLKLLAAMDVKVIRTYNVQFPQAENILKTIKEIQAEEADFEMYVMLGAWIDCKNAWTGKPPFHNLESEQNAAEIDRAVALAQQYQDIVKVIAVGNEAMVKWAAAYYVEPWIILKWVKHLQSLKKKGQLDKNLWITSSDNFASWGGGSNDYHVPELDSLIALVDYISMHTYPMHDTHYNPDFWGILEKDSLLTKEDNVLAAMTRATNYAQNQYKAVANYVNSLGIEKPIHIGETGWASYSDGFYGAEGSAACDEFKQSIYYKQIRDWTDEEGISCFFFEAFDEPWKDAGNPSGSENHFGLFTVDGKAKYVIWDLVEETTSKELTRAGNPITKSYGGNFDSLIKSVVLPPYLKAN